MSQKYPIKTRLECREVSRGWICRVYNFFDEVVHIGKGRRRIDAMVDACRFRRKFVREQKQERSAWRKNSPKGKPWATSDLFSKPRMVIEALTTYLTSFSLGYLKPMYA